MPKPLQKPALRRAVEGDPRWARVLGHESDAPFVYAVTTTGIFCRPHCAARRPKPENVRFFETPRAAERAGFRPCKRCRPGAAAEATPIVELCRLLEASDPPPALGELAKKVGWSASHTLRRFKAATGLTPKEYVAGLKAARLKISLSEPAGTVTQSLYGAGYGSSSRFYETSKERLGMTPRAYRAGGAGVVLNVCITRAALGWVLVAASEHGIAAISLADTRRDLERQVAERFPNAERGGDDAEFRKWVDRVVQAIAEPTVAQELPLDIRGTAFQERVWRALRKIPPGHTTHYAKLACDLGLPRGARAVARACAQNELAVAIPCHRVVGKDGSLRGYRWGLDRKRKLLERERAGSERKK
jgi:AraC family transcriptional regulator of adaptative response/methylated-DNA-[protein]-cysteine methyltransferase